MRLEPPRVAPPTRALTIPELALAARRNLLSIIPDAAYREPWLSGRTVARWHMVMDPAGLETILKDRVEDFPKSPVTLRMLRPAAGKSLFCVEGAEWRWQRRAAAPAFRARSLEALAPFMTDAAARAVRRIEAWEGRVHDLSAEMVAATLDVIAEVALSGDTAMDRAAAGRSVTRYIESVGRVSVLDILGVPGWVPRPAEALNAADTVAMRRVMERIVDARAARPSSRRDLMALMMEAADPEDGRRMDRDELVDNMMAFLVAGHETTALALSWALYLVALDARVQERAAEEARAAIGRGPAEGRHLPALGYCGQVIEEAMRLYPPAGLLSRVARTDGEVAGREVRAGDTVMLPVWALHRHRMLWEDPDRFDPETFAPGRARRRFAYLPFGAGPRICIGQGLAMMEAQIILASVLARFRLRPVPGAVPVPEMIMTVRPRGGIRLLVEPRDGPARPPAPRPARRKAA